MPYRRNRSPAVPPPNPHSITGNPAPGKTEGRILAGSPPVTATQARTAMHKSRLAGFIIDCQTDDLKGAADFWSAALGMRSEQLPAEEGERYVRLLDPDQRLHIEVQSVSHPSRVHLDIETDDIEAEVARLEQLGARVINRVQTWVVMEAPTGQRFCVVRAKGQGLESAANTW